MKLGFDFDGFMRCITSVSYSMIVNGTRGRIFQPSRCLRQGDPVSPFLFLLCSEGLSALLRMAIHEGSLKGVRAGRYGPQFSHLLFANNSLVFGEATI